MHEDNLRMQRNMLYPTVFAASNNANTFYYNQVMKDLDANNFQNAIIK